MDKRLTQIYQLIPRGKGMIDVGTDHAYLPVALAQSGYPGTILASDINEGPLKTARTNAERYGVTEKIGFMLCPGLDHCDPAQVDTIVIAGMGGDMICSILDAAEWCMDPSYTLLLQPMTKPEILRYWLCWNGFSITDYLVPDGRFYYQIIKAVYTGKNMPVSEAELYTGRLECIREYPFAEEFVEKERKRSEKEYSGLSRSAEADPARLAICRTVLTQLNEMKEKIHDHQS